MSSRHRDNDETGADRDFPLIPFEPPLRHNASNRLAKRSLVAINTVVSPWLQGSCRHVASLLQAYLKLHSSLCPPFPRPVTAHYPPPSGKASPNARV